MSFDRNNPADLAALKTEVETDPLGLGYDYTSGNTALVVNGINEVRTVAPTFIASKPNISAADVRAICTYDAYNNLSIDEQEWIRWVTGTNGVQQESLRVTPDLRQALAGDPVANSAIWAASNRNTMNPLMLGLMDVPASRAEDLFGYGVRISDVDWTTARDS